MPDGLSGQEVASAPGMDLSPAPDKVRCKADLNGDQKLNVADVLGMLDSAEASEICLLQIVQEFNKLRLKP